jgi:hypothetical protein
LLLCFSSSRKTQTTADHPVIVDNNREIGSAFFAEQWIKSLFFVRKQYQAIATILLAYWTLQYLNKRCNFVGHTPALSLA